jgi:type III secretion system YscQ/HrcQ family protein
MENQIMADDNLFPDSFEEETPSSEDEVKHEASLPPTSDHDETDHLWEVTPEEKEEEDEEIEQDTHATKNHLTLPKDIPFSIVVEVGHLTMSLEKLLALQPGNILETSVRPEQGVYLTVQGKKIAKGELVKIGDVLGVKILNLKE